MSRRIPVCVIASVDVDLGEALADLSEDDVVRLVQNYGRDQGREVARRVLDLPRNGKPGDSMRSIFEAMHRGEDVRERLTRLAWDAYGINVVPPS